MAQAAEAGRRDIERPAGESRKSLSVILDLKSEMLTEGEVMRNVKSTPEV